MPRVRIRRGHKVFINGSLYREGGIAQIVREEEFNPRCMVKVSDEQPLAVRGQVPQGRDVLVETKVEPETERFVSNRDEGGVDDEVGNAVMGALGQLDHGDDTHWTQAGQPSLRQVSEFAGLRVTRDMLNAVAPEFVRRID